MGTFVTLTLCLTAILIGLRAPALYQAEAHCIGATARLTLPTGVPPQLEPEYSAGQFGRTIAHPVASCDDL